MAQHFSWHNAFICIISLVPSNNHVLDGLVFLIFILHCENWILYCQKWFTEPLKNPACGIWHKAVRKKWVLTNPLSFFIDFDVRVTLLHHPSCWCLLCPCCLVNSVWELAFFWIHPCSNDCWYRLVFWAPSLSVNPLLLYVINLWNFAISTSVFFSSLASSVSS